MEIVLFFIEINFSNKKLQSGTNIIFQVCNLSGSIFLNLTYPEIVCLHLHIRGGGDNISQINLIIPKKK